MGSSLLLRLAPRRPAVATLPQRLELSSSSISLSQVTGGAPVITSTRVRNAVGAGGVLQAPATGTISYVTGTSGWISGIAITPAGSEWTVQVTGDPAALAAGTYVATVPILSFGALDNPRTLTITFTVTAVQQALLSLSSRIDDAVGTVGGANPPSEVVSIISGNATPLAGPTIQSSWFTGALSNFATPRITGSQLVVDYDLSAQGVAGTGFLHTVVQDAAAGNTMEHQTYLSLGAVVTPAAISVQPSAVTPQIQVGSSAATQQLQIGNAGQGGLAGLGTVTVTLGSSVPWVSMAYDAVTGVITLTWATTGLAVGQYPNSLTISATGATNGSIVVPIQLTVSAVQVVPMLGWTLPLGLTQNATTGFVEGSVTGCPTTQPAGWNGAATYSITASSLPNPATALQNALDAAAGANSPVIEVDAGMTISGNFFVRTRTGTGWITLRTKNHASLPARGTRILPTDAANCFTLSSPNSNPVLRFQDNADRFYAVGLRWTDTAPTLNYAHIMLHPTRFDSALGGYVLNDIADQSNQSADIYFDRCIGKGKLNAGDLMNEGSKVGIWASCKRLTIDDSYLYDYMSIGAECQALLIPYGGACYQARNSYLMAAGENFMMGGIKLPYEDDAYNPRDIYFKQCEFPGRWEWYAARPEYVGIAPGKGTQPYGDKNRWECKRGHRILLDGCVAHESMVLGQLGHAFVFKSDNNNQNNLSTPSVSATTNVQMIHCWTYNTKGSVTVQGRSSPKLGMTIPNDRHHILENLFERINVQPNPGNVYIHSVENNSTNIIVNRNVWALNGGATPQGACTVGKASNVQWMDNIIPQCTYGFFGTTVGEGTPAFTTYWTGYTFARNTLYAGSTSTLYPAGVGNQFPATEAAIGWSGTIGSMTQPSHFMLSPSSPYYAGGIFNDALQRIQTRTASVRSP